jgi:hypothetical protein
MEIREAVIDIILKVAMAHHDDISATDEANAQEAADEIIAKLKAELSEEIEHLRVQLTGCGVAALGYAKGIIDCEKGSYGWSASFQDVQDLWDKYEKLVKEKAEWEGRISTTNEMLKKLVTTVRNYADIGGKEFNQDETEFWKMCEVNDEAENLASALSAELKKGGGG